MTVMSHGPVELTFNHDGDAEKRLARQLISARQDDVEFELIAFDTAFGDAFAGRSLPEIAGLLGGTAAAMTRIVKALAYAVARHEGHNDADSVLESIYEVQDGWRPDDD